jgi:uncharacterized protein (DUF58 family)
MPNRNDIFDSDFLARLEGLHLAAKQIAARGPAGQRRSRGIGDGIEFADFRGYTAGDDVRFIDWPYYARMGRLLVRLFHQHAEGGVVVLLDTSASMAPGGRLGKFHHALRIAAAMTFVAMGSLQRVSIMPFGASPREPFNAGRNRQAILPVLDYLARLEPAGPTDMAVASKALMAASPRPALVVLVSDLMESAEAVSDMAAAMAARSIDLTVLHVFEPADAEPDTSGPLLLEHAEREAQLAVSAGPEVLAEYRRQWQLLVDGCERACAARGASYVQAPTDLPFDQLILLTLRRAGVLG